MGSDSLEGRIAELERRLQVVVTHLDVWAAKLTALHGQVSLLQRSLAGFAQDTDCLRLVCSFLSRLD